MEKLRTNITKLLLAGLIWSGIGLYLVRPVQSYNSSDAFTRWLETVVKKGDTESLQKQIYRLNESEHSLYSLIHEASEIVSRHNDRFNLPLRAPVSNSDRVYAMLVMEWNSYQTGNGMAKASVPQTVKPGLHPTVDTHALSFGGELQKPSTISDKGTTGTGADKRRTVSFAIQPLSGGIAIGAP